MKNFPVGAGGKKLQLRLSCFNCCNMAFASPNVIDDIDLRLDTHCNVREDAPYGLNLLRGHRVVELAVKLYF